MNERSDELLAAVDCFIAEHDAWQANEEAKDLTVAYETALTDLVQAFADGDLPGELRTLNDAVGDLGENWAKFEDSGKTQPHHGFWISVETLKKTRSGAEPELECRPVESIKALVEQKVSLAQIAVIYSHEGRGPFMRDELAERRRALNQPAKAGPESVEDLLRQGLTVQQIKITARVTEAEILAEAERLGITPAEPVNLATLRAPHEPPIREQEERAMQARRPEPEPGDIGGADEDTDAPGILVDAQIVALANDGMSSLDIGKRLGITTQKAAAVIRESKRRETVEA